MKAKHAELDQLRARLAPSTEHELYVLSEIELICRQLESEYSNSVFFSICPEVVSSSHLLYLFFTCSQV